MKKTPEKPILLVDDEPEWLSSMEAVLAYEAGFTNVIKCSDSRKVMDLLRQVPCSLVLLDINMPHLSGYDLLPQISSEFPAIKVLVNSGMNQVETAMECVKKGAFNYLIKSTDLNQVVISVHNALYAQGLDEENRRIRELYFTEQVKNPECFSHIITQSKKMQNVFSYCEVLGNSSEPVLVTGESGAGKELIAQAVHKLYCPDDPFVSLNVAGLDDNAFSDTLFGHTKGAYTGATAVRKGLVEKAGSGILFLDEIGDLHLDSQVKLLRLLQEREYYPLGSDSPRMSQARFVFATNEVLEEQVACGKFRKDLFYRLNTHHVALPPLRERSEDIPLLIDFYAEQAAAAAGLKQSVVAPEVYRLLGKYSFPGNVRELRSMIFDAVPRAHNGHIDAQLFSDKVNGVAAASPHVEREVLVNSGVVFAGPLPTLKELFPFKEI